MNYSPSVNVVGRPTWSLTEAFFRSEGDVAEASAILVPTPAEVHAAVQSVLDEDPAWRRNTNTPKEKVCEEIQVIKHQAGG